MLRLLREETLNFASDGGVDEEGWLASDGVLDDEGMCGVDSFGEGALGTNSSNFTN